MIFMPRAYMKSFSFYLTLKNMQVSQTMLYMHMEYNAVFTKLEEDKYAISTYFPYEEKLSKLYLR